MHEQVCPWGIRQLEFKVFLLKYKESVNFYTSLDTLSEYVLKGNVEIQRQILFIYG